jgi:5'-3' exonuclease
MSDPSILSYYPTYSILDEVLTTGKYDTLNLYFDIKNNLQSLYMQHTIVNIVEATLTSKFTDSSIFEAVMQFLSFHKIYAANRNIKINFFIFMETGRSNYHLNISKTYKISRRIDDLYGLDREKREKFFEVVQKNLMLLEKAGNRMPNVKVIRLQGLEADFIPYYLISRKLVDTSKNVGHIVYSNDHDLLQCLNDDVYVYVKIPQIKKIVRKDNALKSYLKFTENYPDSYLPLVMAIIGDTGDNVDGIKGIGGKTVEKIIEEVVQLTGGIDNLFHNVVKGKPIFNSDLTSHPNKYINTIIQKELTEKTISNNLKLVSFEILSRFLDDPISTEMIDKRKIIEKTLQENDIVEIERMRTALAGNRIYLNEDSLDNIYFNGGT